MANAISRKRTRPIGRIITPRQIAMAQIRLNILTPNRQQRTDKPSTIEYRHRSDAAQPAKSRAAQ